MALRYYRPYQSQLMRCVLLKYKAFLFVATHSQFKFLGSILDHSIFYFGFVLQVATLLSAAQNAVIASTFLYNQ